jgi:hypothetical protein
MTCSLFIIIHTYILPRSHIFPSFPFLAYIYVHTYLHIISTPTLLFS